MVRTFQITTSATPQRLSDVYGKAPGVINAADDIPYRHLLLQATGAAVFVGQDATVSTTVFGLAVDPTATTYPIELGPFDEGPIKLSNLWVVGTTGVLHLLGIPF